MKVLMVFGSGEAMHTYWTQQLHSSPQYFEPYPGALQLRKGHNYLEVALVTNQKEAEKRFSVKRYDIIIEDDATFSEGCGRSLWWQKLRNKMTGAS